MKKNITINLFGTLYQIDEDAYDLLKNYQDNMRSYYSHIEGGDEVADDVEHRVAELFTELRANGKEAITIEDVEEIIHRIGDPTQMDDSNSDKRDETKASGNAQTAQESEGRQQRRLFRDTEDKIMGGVISGLCHYLGVENILACRLAFAILCYFSFGTSILLYCLCWALVPEALTAEDRLRMYGRPVNPKAINEEVMRGATVAKEFVNKSSSGVASFLGTLVKAVFYIILGFFGLIAGVVLLSLLVAVIVALFAVPFGLLAGFSALGIVSPEVLSVVTGFPQWVLWTFVVAAIVVLTIPLYAIFRVLTHSKKEKNMSSGVRFGLVLTWIVALAVALSSFGYMTAAIEHIGTREYNNWAERGEKTGNFSGRFSNELDKSIEERLRNVDREKVEDVRNAVKDFVLGVGNAVGDVVDDSFDAGIKALDCAKSSVDSIATADESTEKK